MVTVPALRAFEYDGRIYAAGDDVTVLPVIAAVLARRGDVSLLMDRMARPIQSAQRLASTIVTKDKPASASVVKPKQQRRRSLRRKFTE